MAIVQDLYSTILKITNEMRTEMQATPGLSDSIGFFNFDAHVDETEFPDGDFIGIQAFTVDGEGEPTFEVGVAFVVSTRNDKNLFRHIQMVDHIFNRLKIGNEWRVVSATDGSDVSFLYTMPGRSVLPMRPTETRQVQQVMVSFSTAEPRQT